MVFSSLFFLYCFLPALLLAYFITPAAYRNGFLLIASLLFYSWGEGLFVLLMLFSIGMNYGFGLVVSQAQNMTRRKQLMLLSVVFNLGLLALFKYGHFVIDNVNILFSTLGISAIELAPIHLPIGISFFTFQAMSYVIDVYRHEAPAQKNPVQVALYISLFPQLIAGPIVRYHDIAQQIVERQVTSTLFATGARRFIIGLSKKVLIANTLGYTADLIFTLEPTHVSTQLAWLG